MIDGYQSVVNTENRLSGGGFKGRPNKYVAYIMENGGKDKLRTFLSEDKLVSMEWNVRFFIPETKREYKVNILAKGNNPGNPNFEEILYSILNR